MELLQQTFQVNGISKIYQSPAILGPDSIDPQDDYLNAAVEIIPEMDLYSLLEELKNIESLLGRVRTEDKYAARTIDIDLELIEGIAFSDDLVTIPDPELVESPHIIVPMSDICGKIRIPETTQTIEEIKSQMDLSVVKFYSSFHDL